MEVVFNYLDLSFQLLSYAINKTYAIIDRHMKMLRESDNTLVLNVSTGAGILPSVFVSIEPNDLKHWE